MINVGVKLLDPRAKVPELKTQGAAAADLYVLEDTILPAFCSMPVSTGVAIEIPDNYFGVIALRSGAALNGMMLTNGIGVIDSDYRGELKVLVYNTDEWDKELQAGVRIAQIFFLQKELFCFSVKDELSTTLRGTGGFGSTGLKDS